MFASRSYHHTVYTTMFCWQILHVKVLLRLLIQSYYIYIYIYHRYIHCLLIKSPLLMVKFPNLLIKPPMFCQQMAKICQIDLISPCLI